MKKNEILSNSNFRILRNGKIVTPRKKTLMKKKSILKKSNNQCINGSNDHNNFYVNINNYSDNNIVTTDYSSLVNNYGLYILLKNNPPSIFNRIPFVDCYNKNCYINLEDYIQLNEVLIYNNLEPNIENKSELYKIEKTKKTNLPSNYPKNHNLYEKDDFRKKIFDHSSTNQSVDVRITRGKTIKLQYEQRKQLDQIMFDKFPKNTFKMSVIQLSDITEEIKFLRKLDLKCRFKCILRNSKSKKKI